MIHRILFILGVFPVLAASAQTVEYVRPLSDVARFLTINQERNLEHRLLDLFPLRTLHHAAHGSGKIMEKRITYEILKQHGAKYAVVIFSGSWKNEVSQLGIFRLQAGGYPSPIYHSRSWHSNYSDSYHEIQSMPLGKENVILVKEGENGKSPFVIASLFSFHDKRSAEEIKEVVIINDLTPRLPRLKAIVDFPLKSLYGQSIKLQKTSDHLLLQAADVELAWNHENAPKAIEFWEYNKTSRKFIESRSTERIPVMTRE